MKFMTIHLLSTAFIFLMALTSHHETNTTAIDLQDASELEIADDVTGADLILTNFRTSLQVTNGPCPGGPRANATCNGGPAPTFRMSVNVKNQGTIGLAPGVSFDIQWRAATGGNIVQTIANPNGLPAGGMINVISPTFTMPCPAGPPYALNSSVFGATVDFSGNITECDETNNASAPYPVCHN